MNERIREALILKSTTTFFGLPTQHLPGLREHLQRLWRHSGPHDSHPADVERMGAHRMPLPAYAPCNAVARAYRALWEEVKRDLW